MARLSCNLVHRFRVIDGLPVIHEVETPSTSPLFLSADDVRYSRCSVLVVFRNVFEPGLTKRNVSYLIKNENVHVQV